MPRLSQPGLLTPAGLVAEYAALGEAMRAAGVLIDSGQLSPAGAAKLVRVTAARASVRDGPPPGGGRAPSAYFLIDCPGLATALDWAARIPAARYGTVEVRPPR